MQREAWIKRRPILVIEDNKEDFDILRDALRLADVRNELLRCENGRDVSAYLRAASSQPVSRCPIVILLDLNLPGADGLDILRELRDHPLLCAVPVVVLTSSSQPADVEACYRLGASGYMVKPLDLDHFEWMIRQMSDYWLSCVRLPQCPHTRN